MRQFKIELRLRYALPRDFKELIVFENGDKKYRIRYGLVFFYKTDEDLVSGPFILREELFNKEAVKNIVKSGRAMVSIINHDVLMEPDWKEVHVLPRLNC